MRFLLRLALLVALLAPLRVSAAEGQRPFVTAARRIIEPVARLWQAARQRLAEHRTLKRRDRATKRAYEHDEAFYLALYQRVCKDLRYKRRLQHQLDATTLSPRHRSAASAATISGVAALLASSPAVEQRAAEMLRLASGQGSPQLLSCCVVATSVVAGVATVTSGVQWARGIKQDKRRARVQVIEQFARDILRRERHRPRADQHMKHHWLRALQDVGVARTSVADWIAAEPPKKPAYRHAFDRKHPSLRSLRRRHRAPRGRKRTSTKKKPVVRGSAG